MTLRMRGGQVVEGVLLWRQPRARQLTASLSKLVDSPVDLCLCFIHPSQKESRLFLLKSYGDCNKHMMALTNRDKYSYKGKTQRRKNYASK